MRKLLLLFVPLLSLLMGCTDDNLIGRNDTSDTTSAEGYIRVGISLPAQKDSRAANDDFHNGLPSEFKVNSATLILFEGDSDDEQEAYFHSAYDISSLFADYNADGSQVTSYTLPIITNLTDDDLQSGSKHYFALVLLNAAHMVETSLDHYKVKLAGREIDATKKRDQHKLKALLKYVVDCDKYPAYSKKGGIVMVNAPLATAPGGANNPNDPSAAQVHWLADFTGKIYHTEREATMNPATQIYVERAAAKVTVKAASGSLTNNELEVDDASGTIVATLPWKLVGWQLDLTNRRSFLLRNVLTEWNDLRTASTEPVKPYRFIGDTPVAQGDQRYRTYWAVDPNYDNDNSNHTDSLNVFTNGYYWYFGIDSALDDPSQDTTSDYPMGFGEQWPQYCQENTFDVDNQTQDQTTRALLKVQVGDGKTDYYVVNDDKSHLYTWDALDKKYGITDRLLEFIKNDAQLMETWEDDVEGGPLEGKEPDKEHLDWEFNINDQGCITFGQLGFVFEDDESWCDEDVSNGFQYGTGDEANDNIPLILGMDIKLKRYQKGIAYYALPIKHFGDDLTPWNNKEGQNPTPKEIYPGSQSERNADYLGRYGVVRNNWYNISVNSIFSIGEPVVPPPGNTPDDELSNYIRAQVNILSWTLRDQGADL